jgi:DNA-binding XRE family transcriptional regulator
MTTNKREQIWESLNDPEYRHQFIEELINVGIAFQVKALRNRQNLKQEDLAKRLDVKQPLVSSWENPNYGRYSLSTLKDLAKAFDVGLMVRFVPFSTLVDLEANLSNDIVAPPSFSDEEHNSAATLVSSIKNVNIIDANSTVDFLKDQIQNTPSSADGINDKELIHA